LTPSTNLRGLALATLQISVHEQNDATVVKLVGEGLMGQAGPLAQTLDQIIASAPRLIVIDMAEVTIVTSMVMGTLVKSRGDLRKRGGTLRLAAMPPDVQRVFEVAGLLQFLPCFDTLEQALAT